MPPLDGRRHELPLSRPDDRPWSRLGAAALLLCALAGRAAAESQLVFDVAPFTPEGVGGELLGLSAASGHIVHARIDATFVSNQPGAWTLWVNFALPTGVAGVDSQVEGWSGTGTFTASIETEAFNGQLAPPEGQSTYGWFLQWAGGAPIDLPGGGVGLGPVDGSFTQLVLTLTVCDCPAGPWADLGHALPGALGEPQLSGTGNLCRGAPGSLVLSDARPGGSAFLVVGLDSVWLPFHGGLLIPDLDFLFAALPIDATGHSVLSFHFPVGVPAGLQFWFQDWIPDPAAPAGLSASNALLATVPSDC